MQVSRREFLRKATGMAGILGLQASGLLKLQAALAATGKPAVIWLQGQACTGCSVSLLNSIFYATIDDVVINQLDLEYHPNLMAAAGDLGLSAAAISRPSPNELLAMGDEWLIRSPDLSTDMNGDGTVNFLDFALLAKRGYILVVEGAIPTGSNGQFCEIGNGLTMVEAMRKFGPAATHILAVGSCASFGGIPGAAPDPTGALSVEEALAYVGVQKPLINIPGCPIHPDWLVGTILDLLTGATITLDSYKRPLKFYTQQVIHSRCPFRETEEANILGTGGCLKELGCKGPRTHCDCDIRKWNSAAQNTYGVNWCINGGSPCIGCVEPQFPDGFSPFYTLKDDD